MLSKVKKLVSLIYDKFDSKIYVRNKKYGLGLFSAIVSIAFLFGGDGLDENEPDPTEKSSEQQQERKNDEDNLLGYF